MTMTMGMSRFRTAALSRALALLLTLGHVLGSGSMSTGPGQRRATDFDWKIVPFKDSPVIAFNNATLNNEIIFSYNIPELYVNKTYTVAVYRSDCKTLVANDTALRVRTNSSVDGELVAFVNVNQTTVRGSPYWKDANQTAALLSFCFRVDLYLYNASVNFHETNMTIAIDMTSGFALSTGTPVSSTEQQYADTMADYPVIAYYCDDNNQVIASDNVFLMDGGTLQFCVRIDPSFENILYVRSLLEASLDQAPSDGSQPSHADIVKGSTPDPFTSVRCQSGICNILHHVSSQWFSTPDPPDVVTTGVAVLAFGSPSVFTDTLSAGRLLSLDPDLVPLYGYDGPNITVVNRTTDSSPNITGATGKFRFQTRVAPPSDSGPTALQQGVKIAAYVAAGVAGAAIAALVAAKVIASTALAATGASGAVGDTGSPQDIECDGEGTEENNDDEGEEEGDEYSNDWDQESASADDEDDEEDETNDEEDEDEDDDEENEDDNVENKDDNEDNNEENNEDENNDNEDDENNDEKNEDGEDDDDQNNDEEDQDEDGSEPGNEDEDLGEGIV